MEWSNRKECPPRKRKHRARSWTYLLNAEGEEKQMGTTVLFPPKLEAPNRMGDKLETKFINGEFMMLCSVLNKE